MIAAGFVRDLKRPDTLLAVLVSASLYDHVRFENGPGFALAFVTVFLLLNML